jgi:predicted RNA methylase
VAEDESLCILWLLLLQDMTRTGTYHAAITENKADFEGKVVMDVGAGSGILSLFAAQVRLCNPASYMIFE